MPALWPGRPLMPLSCTHFFTCWRCSGVADLASVTPACLAQSCSAARRDAGDCCSLGTLVVGADGEPSLVWAHAKAPPPSNEPTSTRTARFRFNMVVTPALGG